MSSSPKFTASEWDAWIDQYLASGLSQGAFCDREGLSRFVFAKHYQNSDKFAGKRRLPGNTAKRKDKKATAFRPVQHKASKALDPQTDQQVTLHIGHNVRLQCSAGVGIEAIMRLAREAQS